MSEGELHTVHMDRLVIGLQAGDDQARNDLIQIVYGRLERLARRMLQTFPDVKRWEETQDVLQGSLMRLLRALTEVRPASTREFFNLAAAMIRRQLIDLARSYRGPQGLGANYQSGASPKADEDARPAVEAVAPVEGPDELERWRRFHEEVEELRAEERECFSLLYYHGWTRVQIAELMQVDERTVRRWLNAASARILQRLGGELPIGIDR